MKVLQVIHGYPMRYNAGSEVYTQTLAHGLADRHEVHVFTREENPFEPDYALRRERDTDDGRVKLHVVNMPRFRDRYRHEGVDERFAAVLEEVRPDVVHVGHLNHLSTSLLREAARREIPIVFTLHDYWLMCPRGQFMQMFPEDRMDLWAACDGQEDGKCARLCYARYFSGAREDRDQDIGLWTDWVHRRMDHVREMVELVDLFIAPARYLHERFQVDFEIPESKLFYLDYGFDLSRLQHRARCPEEPFTFGYIGTHIPAKGIHHLVEAFGRLDGNPQLRIWGRSRGQKTAALKALAERLPGDAPDRIEWLPEYKNQRIVPDVFNHVDAIVVSSVWVENSPLVIHEAQQARVPVITADAGGMGEYVHHETNGLLFEHRSAGSLAVQMQRLVDEPALAERLGARGYVYSETGDVPSVQEHVAAVEDLYDRVIARRNSAHVEPLPGPWRITFDTNPDDCNLHCIMCEEHSHYRRRTGVGGGNGPAPRRMDLDLIRRVLRDSRGTGLREVIPSTMGEPLLYEHFDEILDLCEQEGVLLNLTTNGTFPRLGAGAWAERIVPVTSDTKISINGATKETQERIMRGSRWDRLLDNVREFVQVRDEHAAGGGNRCRVTFQVTFLQSNVDELPAIVGLAARLGVDRVKGHHVWVHYDELAPLSMRRDAASIARWNTAVDAARDASRNELLPNGEQVLLDHVFPLNGNGKADIAPGGPCPFLGQEAWVSAGGRFDPCCAPDEQRRTLGEFGDLNGGGIREIWTGERYHQLTSTYRNRALCLSCNMRRPVEE